MKSMVVILASALCICTVHASLIEYAWTFRGSGQVIEDDGAAVVTFEDDLFWITIWAATEGVWSCGHDPGGEGGCLGTEGVLVEASMAHLFWPSQARIEDLNAYWALAVAEPNESGVPTVAIVQDSYTLDGELRLVSWDLEAYDLRTFIGPVSGEAGMDGILHFGDCDGSEAGTIMLEPDSIRDFTFEARLVPEPSTIALIGLGLVGVVASMRRRG